MMLALALLGLTGWMLTAPDQPALPEGGPTLSFFCEACQKPFELTAREVELATRSGAGGDPRSGLSGGFPCKHCQQRRGIRNLPAPETPAAVP